MRERVDGSRVGQVQAHFPANEQSTGTTKKKGDRDTYDRSLRTRETHQRKPVELTLPTNDVPWRQLEATLRHELALSPRIKAFAPRIKEFVADAKAGRYSAALEKWQALDSDLGFVRSGAYRLNRALLSMFGDVLDPSVPQRKRDREWANDPQNDSRWYVANDLGICATALGPLADALKLFDYASGSCLLAARLAIKEKDYALASTQTRGAINALLNRSEALAYSGDLIRMMKTLARAQRLLERAVRYAEKIPAGEERDAELEACAQRRRDLIPYVGYATYLAGEVEGARLAFNEAGPLEDQPRVWKARCLLSLGDVEGAKSEAEGAFNAAWHVKKNERAPVTAAQALVVLADLEPTLSTAKKLYNQALKILETTSAEYAKQDALSAKISRL